MLVTHQHIWKPGMFGGVVSRTLCGVKSGIESDKANLNVGDDVSCKNCKSILSGKRKNWASKFVGMTADEVEQMAT